MFGDIGGGAAIFAAQRQPLNQPQRHQQDRRGDADAGVAGQDADGKGREAHQAHGDEEGVFAPDQIAEPPEHQRAERAHRKPGGKGAERQDEAGGFVDPGEEFGGNDRGEQAVKVEIIPFEHSAKRRGDDHLALALACRCCRCGHPAPPKFVSRGMVAGFSRRVEGPGDFGPVGRAISRRAAPG